MQRIKSIIGLAAAAAMLSLPVQAQELAPEAESQGRIDKLDFGAYEAQISGYDYTVSPSAKVEINNTFGAFTMLEEGMLVQFYYLQFSDGKRQIIEMREVDVLEEH